MAQTAPASSAQTIYAQSVSASVLAQRRRSTAHPRPAGPPPAHPIPSLPPAGPPPAAHLPPSPPDDRYDEQPYEGRPSLGSRPQQGSFARPAPSPNLTAVAGFSDARYAAAASSSRGYAPVSPSSEDLLDPPPPSILQAAMRSQEPPPQPPSPDRLEPPSENRRPPSSRRALTRALELAREAVELDSSNVDPEAAVMAYGRSVALLSEVMERVRRGEDSTDPRKRNGTGRRRSVVAQEEEIRRLQQIHDTYADRMNILSLIYSIPPIPYNSAAMYAHASTSEASTRSPSPSTSTSTRSETETVYTPATARDEHHVSGDQDSTYSGVEAIGSAMFLASSDEDSSSSSHHPYSAASQVEAQGLPQIITPVGTLPGTRTSVLRARSNSGALPPPAPPPLTSPPPAPTVSADNSPNIPPPATHHLNVVQRQRGNSVGHRRTGSGSRLAALQEEQERYEDGRQTAEQREDEYEGRNSVSDTPRAFSRESPPLPPIPSPTSSAADAPNTPRSQPATLPPSPRTTGFVARPRGSSQLASRQDASSPPIINPSTTQGTIYMRRSKIIAAASSDTSSPTESSVSLASTSLPKASVVSLTSSSSSSSVPGMVMSRSRSSSQPGRRPSIVGGQQSPSVEPPPLPMNGTAPRKASIPQKLNPFGLSVQTDFFAPSPLAAASPMTPVSPLPPTAPSDALLKPYHMMNLLRGTMESSTGGYVTRRLHVPQEVWSQGGAKLNNTSEKVRVVAILCSALEELQLHSAEVFGAGNVSSGLAMGIGSITRKEADAWTGKLEEFSSICDGVVASFGKKLSVGEGFIVKKSTWGDRMTRSFDKLTNNGKTLDSPAAYVQGLRKLFLHVQLLDEHTKAVKAHPVAPAYAAFAPDMRSSIETKLKRCSEFFATVILTFVIRDLAQLLDKYVKRCEKWLEE